MKNLRIEKIKKDKIIIVHGILGASDEGLVTRLKKNVYKFNYDAYVYGCRSKIGFSYIIHARKYIPEKKLENRVKCIPSWYGEFLHRIGLKPIYIPNGTPICYCDEIVIPDYSFVMLSCMVHHYFIIKRSDLDKYINEFKKNKENPSAYCLSFNIGHKFEQTDIMDPIINPENKQVRSFLKINLFAEDNSNFSIIYPFKNIIHSNCKWTLPNPKLATKIGTHPYWLNFFYSPEAEGVSPEEIVYAKRIIIEFYDSNNTLQDIIYVYDKYSQKVHKESIKDFI